MFFCDAVSGGLSHARERTPGSCWNPGWLRRFGHKQHTSSLRPSRETLVLSAWEGREGAQSGNPTTEEGHKQATAPTTDNTHTTWATTEEGGAREQEVEGRREEGGRSAKNCGTPAGRRVSPGKDDATTAAPPAASAARRAKGLPWILRLQPPGHRGSGGRPQPRQ